jgi:hypothetical protein
MPNLPPLPGQYSVQTVESNGDRILLFVDGEKERLELHPRTRRPVIQIRRPDKGVEWSVSPDTNVFSEVKLPPADAELQSEIQSMLSMEGEWDEDGTELIDGHLCTRFVERSRHSPVGQPCGHTVCQVDVQTGMRRRDSHYAADGELVATVDYVVGPPPPGVFELPEGCKKV